MDKIWIQEVNKYIHSSKPLLPWLSIQSSKPQQNLICNFCYYVPNLTNNSKNIATDFCFDLQRFYPL